MLYSAEVRWFFVGQPSTDVISSFAGRSDTPEEHRIDVYLLFEGNDSLGVKVRDVAPGLTALELKVRTTPSTPLLFRNGQAGQVATWVKWSTASVESSLGVPRSHRPRNRGEGGEGEAPPEGCHQRGVLQRS